MSHSSIVLRDYQSAVLHEIEETFAVGVRSACTVMPCGAGKTTVFGELARRHAARGERVLVMVHRQELLTQASERIAKLGVPCGIIAAGRSGGSDAAVQVGSIKTLVRRLDIVAPPQLIIPDECHHAPIGEWRAIIDRFPEARILGVTATPCRTDGKPLASLFETMIAGPNMSTLIAAGHLTDAEVWAPELPPLGGIGLVSGDYDPRALASAMNKPSITGCAVAHYARLCPGRRAVAFCVNVAHAEAVAAAFAAAGWRAACLHGRLGSDERKRILDALAEGTLDVVTNCGVIEEGFDLPSIAAAILLRPTRSLIHYLQTTGRAFAPLPARYRRSSSIMPATPYGTGCRRRTGCGASRAMGIASPQGTGCDAAQGVCASSAAASVPSVALVRRPDRVSSRSSTRSCDASDGARLSASSGGAGRPMPIALSASCAPMREHVGSQTAGQTALQPSAPGHRRMHEARPMRSMSFAEPGSSPRGWARQGQTLQRCA